MSIHDVVPDKAHVLRLWPLALAALILAYLIQNVRSYRRLSMFPGPKLAAVSNLWNFSVELTGKNFKIWEETCEKYGPIVRIAPNVLLTCDEEFARRLSAVRSPYRRNQWFQAIKFEAEKENVLSEIDPEKHANMRSRVAPGYSGKENAELEPGIDHMVRQFIDLIRRKYISTPTEYRRFDLAQTMQFFTLDIITSLALSKPFGFLERDEDVYDYVKIFESQLAMMNFMVAWPLANTLMRQVWFKKLSIWAMGDKAGLGKTKVVAREIILRRFGIGGQKENRKDMIGSFVAHGLTPTECVDQSLVQILAGSDSTSTSSRMTLLHIFSNPRVHNRLLAEIASANVPLSEIISDRRARELPYLQACIKEGLRIFPVAGGLMLKDAPPEGDYLDDGTFIPGSTAIGFCSWAVHRNKAVFGPDAKVYRPERWLEAPPEQLARMERTHDISFGYGKFKCLGMAIAKVELNKVVFELVRRFEFTVEDVSRPVERQRCFGLFLQKGIWCRVVEREQKTEGGEEKVEG